jgi:hypothetical protein
MQNLLQYLQTPYPYTWILFAALIIAIAIIAVKQGVIDEAVSEYNKQSDILFNKESEIEKWQAEVRKQTELALELKGQSEKYKSAAYELIGTIETYIKERELCIKAKEEAQRIAMQRGDELLKLEDARLYLEKKSKALTDGVNELSRENAGLIEIVLNLV